MGYWFEVKFDLISSLIYSVKNNVEDNLSGHLREETQLNEDQRNSESYARSKRAYEGILDANKLQMLEEKRDIFYLLSFILHNTKPVGHQVSVMLMTAKVDLHVIANFHCCTPRFCAYKTSLSDCRILSA